MRLFILLMTLHWSVWAQNSPQEDFKLITWNIWNGFDYGKDQERKAKAIDWLNLQQPDILALQELNGYTETSLNADAKKWQHSYSALLKTSGYSVGLTSKYPIKVVNRIMDGMHHGALHCRTNGLDVLVIHLSPFQWEKRMEELQKLTTYIQKINAEGRELIICGDFNAVSPYDAVFYRYNEILRKDRLDSDAKHGHVQNMKDGDFHYEVLAGFLELGLFDSVANFTHSLTERISCPTAVFGKTDQERRVLRKKGERIDYILLSNYLNRNCVYAEVENGDLTGDLSDHYPVVAKIKFQD